MKYVHDVIKSLHRLPATIHMSEYQPMRSIKKPAAGVVSRGHECRPIQRHHS